MLRTLLFIISITNAFANVERFGEYLSELGKVTGIKYHYGQRKALVAYYKENKKEIWGAALTKKHENFNTHKTTLIKTWEEKRNTKWPSYKHTPEAGNRKPGDNYDAHHIIPQSHNGPNVWWNLIPLTQRKHHKQHRNGTLCSELFPASIRK